MKPKVRNGVQILCYAICLILLGSVGHASGFFSGQFETGQKAKVKDTKTGLVVVVSVSDDTKFERKKGAFKFRREDMDVTAMVPGLGIEAEGVGNAQGQLDATKISFSPDDFAISIAEEQQIMANQASAQKAQSTADQGVSQAQAAQVLSKQRSELGR